jgi:hypothetical protein
MPYPDAQKKKSPNAQTKTNQSHKKTKTKQSPFILLKKMTCHAKKNCTTCQWGCRIGNIVQRCLQET